MVSVTQCLSIVNRYSGVSRAVLDRAAAIGTAVHAHCLGGLKGYYAPVPAELEHFVNEFREWSNLAVEDLICAEHELIDRQMALIGHVDFIAKLKSQRAPAIIDLKRISGKPDWCVGLQLAAYQHLAEKSLGKKFPLRFALHMNADAKLELIPFRDPNDWPLFLSAYSLYNQSRR